jgi:hypothetical protein
VSRKEVSGTAKAAKAKFCDTIYVIREDDVLCLSEDINDIDDAEAVAIYEFKEVRRKVVIHDLR